MRIDAYGDARSAQQEASPPGVAAGVTPGPPPPQNEMVNVLESVAKGFQGAMDSALGKFAELQSKEKDEPTDFTIDKFQAISGLEFKRSPPIIRDDDPESG